MIEVGVLFKAAGIAKAVADFLGLLESLDAKIDRLIHSELEAGLRALEQAGKSVNEQDSLLRESRGRFNKAVSLEKGLRLAMANLGLALSHHWLGDSPNRDDALRSILALNPVKDYALAMAHMKEAIANTPYNAPVVDDVLFFVSLPVWIVSRVARRVMAGVKRKETLKEYLNRVANESLAFSAEAKNMAELQNTVAQFLGESIPWRIDSLAREYREFNLTILPSARALDVESVKENLAVGGSWHSQGARAVVGSPGVCKRSWVRGVVPPQRSQASRAPNIGVQATAYSVRSSLAPASSRA